MIPSRRRLGFATLVALAAALSLPFAVQAAASPAAPIQTDATPWQPADTTAMQITGALALEMTRTGASNTSAMQPVALHFDRLGRMPVQFIGEIDPAAVAPARVWVANLDQPDAALSCGAKPVKAVVIATEPHPEEGNAKAMRLNLYGLDQKLASVPNVKRLPTACFAAEYLQQ